MKNEEFSFNKRSDFKQGKRKFHVKTHYVAVKVHIYFLTIPKSALCKGKNKSSIVLENSWEKTHNNICFFEFTYQMVITLWRVH